MFNQQMTWLEFAGMLTGLAGVWLTVRASAWCFPTGILCVSIYAYIFFHPTVRLYADGILQLIFLPLQTIGWINWRTRRETTTRITRTPRKEWGILFLVFLAGWFFLSSMLHRYTNAYLPWLDGALTTLSLIAQWQIARKQLENWLLWIFVDILYIPLYFSRDLPLTAFLYLIFLFMAIAGYRAWRKQLASDA